MLKSLSQILDGFYGVVNALDNLEMSQQFATKGKNDGSIFIRRIGQVSPAFRLSFATAGNQLMYTIGRGNSISEKIVPRTVIMDDDDTPGQLTARQKAVHTAIQQLTALSIDANQGIDI